jgi:hypothetical protein
MTGIEKKVGTSRASESSPVRYFVVYFSRGKVFYHSEISESEYNQYILEGVQIC